MDAQESMVSGLTAIERRRVAEFLDAIRTPCECWRASDSFFNNAAFEESFRSKLLVHHCFVGSPLVQQSFDAAFITACDEAGLSVEPASDGQRFWDVRVAGLRISLKSTKAKDLKPAKLHISKLTEAAWIQDCRSAARRERETKALFAEYRSEVDLILQFRYFAARSLYELVEVPGRLFDQVADVGRQSSLRMDRASTSRSVPIRRISPSSWTAPTRRSRLPKSTRRSAWCTARGSSEGCSLIDPLVRPQLHP
jgi:hypothetical protein